MSEKVLMKGNEAVAESAIRAGCRHFFGYPITPQTEVAAYFAKRMPKIGGTYLQAESEIAAINMVLGAGGSGARAMTSSSSPGISLKTEGISYICGSDVPCVIMNIERGGPGLGGIQPSQSDYYQATKAPGHGDLFVSQLGGESDDGRFADVDRPAQLVRGHECGLVIVFGDVFCNIPLALGETRRRLRDHSQYILIHVQYLPLSNQLPKTKTFALSRAL